MVDRPVQGLGEFERCRRIAGLLGRGRGNVPIAGSPFMLVSCAGMIAAASGKPTISVPPADCKLTDMTQGHRFPLGSILRGRLAERIITVLLERGGYRYTRLGIEELFDEIKYLPREEYLQLNLPDQLRTIPDLLVADQAVTWAKLVEVKYRRSFDEETAAELLDSLMYQRMYWPDSHAVIIIGQPFVPDGKFHQDYIRVIPPGDEEALTGRQLCTPYPDEERGLMERIWDSLPMLHTIFRFHDFDYFGEESLERLREFWKDADMITASIRELAQLF